MNLVFEVFAYLKAAFPVLAGVAFFALLFVWAAGLCLLLHGLSALRNPDKDK